MEQLEENEFLREYGHWTALGIAVFFLLITVYFNSQGKIHKTLKQTKTNYNELQKIIINPPPKPQPIPDYIGQLRVNWEQNVSLDVGPESSFLYKGPTIKYDKETPPAKKWLNSPRRLIIERGREDLRISWQSPAAKTGKEMTDINGYLLSKRWKEDGKVKAVLLDLGTRKSYEDEDLDGRLEYLYQVYAYTTNKDAQGGEPFNVKKFKVNRLTTTLKNLGGEKKAFSKIVVSAPTKAKKSALLPVYRMQLQGVAGKTAIIRLEKFIKGEWRGTSCNIQINKPIEYIGRIRGMSELGSVKWQPGWILGYVNPREKKPIMRDVVVYENGVRTTKKRKEFIMVGAIGFINDRKQKERLYRGDFYPKDS